MAAAHLYEIRVEGTVPAEVFPDFGDLRVSAEPAVTVIRGPLDQAGLHGLLARLELYCVELLGFRRCRRVTSR